MIKLLDRNRKEAGDLTVMSVIGMIITVIMLIMLINFGGAIAIAIHERNALMCAKDSVSQNDYQFILKNDSNWSSSLAKRITQGVDFFGLMNKTTAPTLKIVMYEIPPTQINEKYRVVVWGAELGCEIKTSLTSTELPIKRYVYGSITFYSSSKVWGRDQDLYLKQGYSVVDLTDPNTVTVNVSPNSSVATLCSQAGIDSSSPLAQKLQEQIDSHIKDKQN